MASEMSSLQLEFVLELRVSIGSTLELDSGPFGKRRTVPITGGTFSGAFSGRVLPGGADWQFVECDGLTFVNAHYVIETEDGVRIEVRNQGIRHGAQEVMNRLAAGEAVPATEYYFRTTPRFYPSDGKYSWLKRSVFVASGERLPDVVVVKVWNVL